MVLSDGGWCKAEIVEHEKSCLKVKWIGFPKEPLFAVSYSTAPTTMFRKYNVNEANQAATDLKKLDKKIMKIELMDDLECGVPGCEYTTKDPKRLAAHRKLFHPRIKATRSAYGDAPEGASRLRIVESAVNRKVHASSPRRKAEGVETRGTGLSG